MPRGNRRNYYRILHVQPDAPVAVIKSSYRALMLSLEMHPDRGGDHRNAALINEAYAVLCDSRLREDYDRRLRAAGGGLKRSRGSSKAATRDASTAAGSDCVFCGQTFGLLAARAACARCRSPLTPAVKLLLEEGEPRRVMRLARSGTVTFWTDWPQPRPHVAELEDLSPNGLRLRTGVPLRRYQILKLETPILNATGRVTHCRRRTANGEATHVVGVDFYTLDLIRSAGTFLSAQA